MKIYDRYYEENKYFRGLNPNELATQSVEYLSTGKAIDLGCGEGQDSVFLTKRGFDVTAIDSSKMALDNLLKLAEDHDVAVDVIQSDVMTFKFKKNYDLVLAEGTIHFLDKDELEPFIRMLQEHTNMNGIHSFAFFNNNTCKNQIKTMSDWGISTVDTKLLESLYEGWEVLSIKEELEDSNKYTKRGMTILIVKRIV